MKIYRFCFCLIFLFISSAFAQHQINLKITDAETKENLAFTNISFNDDKTCGVISDI